MSGANGQPHPDGDRWGKVLNDEELERMYRAHSGGGGIHSSGCLIVLAWFALLGFGAVQVVRVFT